MKYITPNWPAPKSIRAFTTTRHDGVSEGAYASLNLGAHVGDDPNRVQENRTRLAAQLPNEPVWLTQTHSTTVLNLDHTIHSTEADACITHKANQVCVVMTADCLPLLVCDTQGKTVAAIHAGWRGLANGIIEKTLDEFSAPADSLLVWLGPAIGPQSFEVGDDVRDQFMAHNLDATTAFTRHGDRWLADLYTLAKQRLLSHGVQAIYGGDFCTYRQADDFFSYRRDGVTGRMASVIWRTGND